jgi:hypothetical protein
MDSSDFDAAVAAMFSDFGGTAYYLRGNAGNYDPSQGEYTATQTSIPVSAIVLDFNLKKDGMGEAGDSLVKVGDKQVFIRPPQKTEPFSSSISIDTTSDRIQIGSTVYKIVTFKEINTSADNQVLIELYVRR